MKAMRFLLATLLRCSDAVIVAGGVAAIGYGCACYDPRAAWVVVGAACIVLVFVGRAINQKKDTGP
jgi:hypothetical protein